MSATDPLRHDYDFKSGLRRRLGSALWFGLITAAAMGLVHPLWSAENLHRWTFAAMLLAAGYYGGALGYQIVGPRADCTRRQAALFGLGIAVLSVATGLLVELITRGHSQHLTSLIVLLWTLPLLLILDYWPMLVLCMIGGAVLHWLAKRFR